MFALMPLPSVFMLLENVTVTYHSSYLDIELETALSTWTYELLTINCFNELN